MLRIKELRRAKKLTSKELASRVGVAESTMSLYENGKREPSLKLLLDMSYYFNVSINFLITGEEFKKR